MFDYYNKQKYIKQMFMYPNININNKLQQTLNLNFLENCTIILGWSNNLESNIYEELKIEQEVIIRIKI
jgi:hypothetical protein